MPKPSKHPNPLERRQTPDARHVLPTVLVDEEKELALVCPYDLEEEAPDTETSATINISSDTLTELNVPTLKVLEGPDILCFITLDPGISVVIGREEGSHLQLHDRTVSKRHARVTLQHNGKVLLEDLGSTNGTRVAGNRVFQSIWLSLGDRFQAGQVLLAVENLPLATIRHLWKLRHRLEDAANDRLTGLKTRRYLDDELPHMMESAWKTSTPLCVIFLDIDHFKRVNDSYGHSYGDDVLRGVSRCILDKIRDTDLATRYGGEEIIILLPGSNLKNAVETGERLRISVAALTWNTIAPDLKITVSLGIAQAREGESVRDWLNRADMALYRAKESGRNQVQTA
jgi:diguanylate cyclase (GGDEF)-like protein